MGLSMTTVLEAAEATGDGISGRDGAVEALVAGCAAPGTGAGGPAATKLGTACGELRLNRIWTELSFTSSAVKS